MPQRRNQRRGTALRSCGTRPVLCTSQTETAYDTRKAMLFIQVFIKQKQMGVEINCGRFYQEPPGDEVIQESIGRKDEHKIVANVASKFFQEGGIRALGNGGEYLPTVVVHHHASRPFQEPALALPTCPVLQVRKCIGSPQLLQPCSLSSSIFCLYVARRRMTRGLGQ